jgi:hypothetical protein
VECYHVLHKYEILPPHSMLQPVKTTKSTPIIGFFCRAETIPCQLTKTLLGELVSKVCLAWQRLVWSLGCLLSCTVDMMCLVSPVFSHKHVVPVSPTANILTRPLIFYHQTISRNIPSPYSTLHLFVQVAATRFIDWSIYHRVARVHPGHKQ